MPEDFVPVIVAENHKVIPKLSVSGAVMQLEVGSAEFVLFRTQSQNRLNMVYRRQDQNIGWLELESEPDPS
jgi:hypothetical protein